MTYVARPSSMPGAISPVNAPFGSGCRFCAPTPMSVPRSALGDRRQRHERRTDDPLDAVERLQPRQHRVDQRQPLGDGRVHLPVAGDDRLARGHQQSLLQRGHAGQDFAFDELQRGAAAGRDVGELVGQRRPARRPGPTRRRRRSSSRASRPARARPRSVPVGEARILEDAHRAVPEHRAGAARSRVVNASTVVRADVDDHLVGARRRRPAHGARRRAALQVGGDDHVASAGGSCRRGAAGRRRSHEVGFEQAACRPRGPAALRNVLAMPPPISRRSTRSIRFSSTPSLDETLAPPTIATNGRFGFSSAAAEDDDLLLHQQPGHRGQEMRDAFGRGVRAVGGAEGVVDVHVAQPGQLGRRSRRRWPLPRRGSARSRAARPRPAPSALTASCGGRPTQSVAKRDTARRAARRARSATGCSEYFGSGLPSGRPRCDSRTTCAPCSRRYWSVGSAARMRVSSATRPSCIGAR